MFSTPSTTSATSDKLHRRAVPIGDDHVAGSRALVKS